MTEKWWISKENWKDGDSLSREDWNVLVSNQRIVQDLYMALFKFMRDRYGIDLGSLSFADVDNTNFLSGDKVIGLTRFDSFNSNGNSIVSKYSLIESNLNTDLDNLDEKVQIVFTPSESVSYTRGAETYLSGANFDKIVARERLLQYLSGVIRYLMVVKGATVDEINKYVLSSIGFRMEVTEGVTLSLKKIYWGDIDPDLSGASMVNPVYGEGRVIVYKDNGDGTYYLACIDVLNREVVAKTLFTADPLNSSLSYYKFINRVVYFDEVNSYWRVYIVRDWFSGTAGNYVYVYFHKYVYDLNGSTVTSSQVTLMSDIRPWDGGTGNFVYSGSCSVAMIEDGWLYFIVGNYWKNISTGDYYARERLYYLNDVSGTALTQIENIELFDDDGSQRVHGIVVVDNVLAVCYGVTAWYTSFGGQQLYEIRYRFYSKGTLLSSYTKSFGTEYAGTTLKIVSTGVNCIIDKYGIIRPTKAMSFLAFGGVGTDYRGWCWSGYVKKGSGIMYYNNGIVSTSGTAPTDVTLTLMNCPSMIVKTDVYWRNSTSYHDIVYRDTVHDVDRTQTNENYFATYGLPSLVAVDKDRVYRIDNDGIVVGLEWTADEDFIGWVIVTENSNNTLGWGYPSVTGILRFKNGQTYTLNNGGMQTTVNLYKVKMV